MSTRNSNNGEPTKNELERSSDLPARQRVALAIWEASVECDDESHDDAALLTETLKACCDTVVRGSPDASECLARLFAILMECLDRGMDLFGISKGGLQIDGDAARGA